MHTKTLALARPALAALVLASSIAHGQEIRVTDQTGREVTLSAPAERVVTIPIPLASGLVAVDGGIDRLVGMNASAFATFAEAILGRIFPGYVNISADVAAQSFAPNVEHLLTLAPDAVYQWGGRGDDIVTPLTNAGLTTLLALTGSEQTVRGNLTMLAETIGKPERIEAIVDWRQRVQDEIEAKTATLSEADRPRAIYITLSTSSINTIGKSAYLTWNIELSGGRSVSADLEGTTPVTKEQILAWDPEVIFLNGAWAELTMDWVYEDPILSLVTAAQDKRVYKMPSGGNRWDSGNHESPLVWMYMANLLQPDLFQYDLREAIREGYRTLYNYEVTDADLDEILRLDTQGDAANYGLFHATAQ